MYRVIFTAKAKKQYQTLGKRLKRQVDKGISRIARNPKIGKPLGGELKGIRSERVSTYRILYKIYEDRIEILILVIEHRKSIYGGH